MRKILNFVLFQAGWFVCVLGGAHGMPVAAVAAAGAVIGVSLWWFSTDRMSEVLNSPWQFIRGLVGL